MEKEPVYQCQSWKEIRKKSGETVADTEMVSFIIEKNLPLVGKKRILNAEGTPGVKEDKLRNLLSDFKKKSKNFSYGTVMPTVLNEQREVFEKEGFHRIANHTILIDIKKTEEELYKGLEKKSARWGVNFAKKQNLVFSPAKESEINDFYKTYKKKAQIGGFKPEKKIFLQLTRDTPISKLFTIKKEKKLVAGGLILIDMYSNYSILNLTASTEEGNKLQAMPFLYWNLILFSKSLGLNYFDLGGYDIEAKKNEKTHNINKFKNRFGGKIVEQPIYSTSQKYILGRKAYSWLKRLR